MSNSWTPKSLLAAPIPVTNELKEVATVYVNASGANEGLVVSVKVTASSGGTSSAVFQTRIGNEAPVINDTHNLNSVGTHTYRVSPSSVILPNGSIQIDATGGKSVTIEQIWIIQRT